MEARAEEESAVKQAIRVSFLNIGERPAVHGKRNGAADGGPFCLPRAEVNRSIAGRGHLITGGRDPFSASALILCCTSV